MNESDAIVEAVVRHFAGDDFMNIDQVRVVARHMQIVPNPAYRPREFFARDADEIIRWIDGYGFCEKITGTGWIEPDGTFHSAKYGCHEALVDWLGKNTHEVEKAGWIRVSPYGTIQGLFKPTPQQMAKYRRMGHKTDADMRHEFRMMKAKNKP